MSIKKLRATKKDIENYLSCLLKLKHEKINLKNMKKLLSVIMFMSSFVMVSQKTKTIAHYIGK